MLLALEDLGEQVAADEVVDLFAMGDRALQLPKRLQFELQVALQDLFDILADVEPGNFAAAMLDVMIGRKGGQRT